MSQRAVRVAGSIQRELNELLRELKDPRVQAATLITITNVRVSDDLGIARVQVSIIADDAREVMRALSRSRPWMQVQLGRRMGSKKTPELRFHVDETEQRAGRIDDLLREVASDAPVGESSDPGRPVRLEDRIEHEDAYGAPATSDKSHDHDEDDGEEEPGRD